MNPPRREKFALLDRDGTIILDKVYLSDPKLIEFAPGAIKGLQMLRDAGFALILVTNQSGVARGYFDENCINRVHDRLGALLAGHELELAAIYFCPHGPDDACACRKPEPGMARKAMTDFGFSAEQAVVIGDSVADVGMAEAAGLRAIRIGTDPGCARDFLEAAQKAITLCA
ncbi:HAD family hydrolase [Rhodoblastus acidophilus]|uniref:D,D-heptose 1,7-bisphosphate phosphatase n=1 Tax=Candidatus Rhodoblastus alkanivorans TaxID=2954117 RepID=A0ABS9Z8K1_9HYPH|nr:HAD family hydrolase [Candidatus Rhodoblastus alkanivorans]MCI4679476.1 HAD family hydrolase [Candidatus Rhodoblastus alkanivorans]MCI4683921.1 HAD family hydrolase [Candidatus Rhodoblastus alkanivorans]MDI4641240.1 HAD family hydrolase [Rhodoblastus acidophilus]